MAMARLGGVVVAVVAACRSAPPERLDSLTPMPRPSPDDRPAPSVSSAPRPTIDLSNYLPDFHDELRWPLSPMTHPQFAPAFDVGTVFAQPGHGWTDLCERRVYARMIPGRHDELVYLRGWCYALEGNASAAAAELADLRSSQIASLAVAVKIDLANILATAGSAERAAALLARFRVDDVEVYDVLASIYFELDRPSDAAVINNRALSFDSDERTRCVRLARGAVFGTDAEPFEDLTLQATHPLPDATCVALYHAVSCHIGPSCVTYFKDRAIDLKVDSLVRAYRSWPRVGTYSTWTAIGDLALKALPTPGADAIAKSALGAALDVAPPCEPGLLQSLSWAVSSFAWPRFSAELARCRGGRR